MNWFLYDRDLSQECLEDILDDVNRKCEEHMLKRVIEHKNEKTNIFVEFILLQR